ncbi:hypothetical protein DPMN_115603 [Dreissena polymorpha]|uniref:Uncharacterized protein n=1 Tax=Dreissena polymorpha TaxID=45954 RepID=A0A9D4QTX2_DREPO|nr:hypothetical protein DPMN_115603 [Dreissena polymorpha]
MQVINVSQEDTLYNGLQRLDNVLNVHNISEKLTLSSRIRRSLVHSVRKPLFIGGLFDLLGGGRNEAIGRSEITAARLAVSHINKLSAVPGYELILMEKDTKVTGSIPIVEAFFRSLPKTPSTGSRPRKRT